ncbi:MAG TPA: HD domain-containing protein [Candidatus Marinimicrobia bacterium]|jgi:putative nucleotidyltransferase with HDIG domain|nr:tRNA nucleotidyltransferase [Candidatus Neomarinimicrobiota bacterium]MDP6276102.1 HD domain-containing protein [Candidatus Neomarinimicrobiota bacterium]MDP7217425.1 HD domain-containing protein [Candidatus Neomarinimicrobiota bacterium]MDP7436598.1 HD domain-containing protein [Candidatus Neomarinimicrobiota bacterium]HJL75121.1 HD domain-containing protein [Candidatus Neomarinimicrobiota bacterium]|tara:strand:+ start:19959 stop:21389 length:1431 start_codon:yes stop_codon:yes gene_type:complete
MANIHHLIAEDTVGSKVLKIAGELGVDRKHDVFVVGGYVRDLFLGRPLKEIDFMVMCDGVEFAEELAKKLKVKKIVPFPTFSTAKIPYKPIPLEVAAARTETYDKGSRKPKEVIYTDLQGDLVRRDFTVNALAVDLHPDRFGELHDPHGGMKELNAKRLKTPLDSDETFNEDPLRMMRAAYFAAALDFEIDEKCLQAIQTQANRICIVSQERITAELIKILITQKPSIGLNILQKTGLMKYVFPEIDAMYGLEQTSEWNHKDIFYHTMQVVDNAAQLSDKMELRFAALVHDIAKPNTRRIDKKKGYTFHGHDAVGERILNKVAKHLKLSNELRDYLKKLTLLHLRPIALVKEDVTGSAVRRVMAAAGEDLDDLITLCRADITTRNPKRVQQYLKNFEIVEAKMSNVEERDAMRAFQSPVRGHEIMETFGLTEGIEVGKIKRAIEEAILNGEIDNEHDAAKEYMQNNKDMILTDQKG